MGIVGFVRAGATRVLSRLAEAFYAGAAAICQECSDGDGGTIYPYRGLAPYVCGYTSLSEMAAAELPCDEWPANFLADPDQPEDLSPRVGTYTHCLACGAGR